MVTLGSREIIKKINSLLMDDVSLLPFCASLYAGESGNISVTRSVKKVHITVECIFHCTFFN